MQTISTQDLVIVSGEFGRYPSSIEHMVRRLAERHRILWVELTGMRRPTMSVYDLRRAAGKIVRLVNGAQRTESGRAGVPPSISLASPFTIPFPGSRLVQRFNDQSLLRSIVKETKARGFKDYGLITTLPMAAGSVASQAVLKDTGVAWTMYYCPDEWTLWPGMDCDLVSAWEKQLLNTVDHVVVSSEQLRVSKSGANRRAVIVRHGVDVDHFASAFIPETARKITFFGLFDQRIDQQLIGRVARNFPDYTVEIIGPVQTALPSEYGAENICFTGPVPYRLLPEKLADARVLILPYLRNELTDNINPLKGRECLATGKPVVATALPELKELEHIFLGESHEDFLGHLAGLLNGPARYDGRRAIDAMYRHSWDARAVDLIAAAGQKRAWAAAVARAPARP